MAADDLITLDEARAALRIPDSVTGPDADLSTLYIPAITAMVEDVTGPVVQRPVTQTLHGGGAVVLAHMPTSVTSVTVDGIALTEFTADLSAGIIRAGTSTSVTAFSPGLNAVVVAYVAGIAATTEAVPAPIKLAARLILAHLWQVDQQGYRPQFGQPDDSPTVTPSGFAIPRRAYALLEPYSHRTFPGFA